MEEEIIMSLLYERKLCLKERQCSGKGYHPRKSRRRETRTNKC